MATLPPGNEPPLQVAAKSLPPPTSAAIELEWCGASIGGTVLSDDARAQLRRHRVTPLRPIHHDPCDAGARRLAAR